MEKETLQVTIEKIVYPGRSLSRAADGITVFTEGALPGEVVEIDVTKKKKSFKEGRLAAIITPSPERISPRCPSFGKCGGCTFQHTSYARQMAIKGTYVHELLERFNAPIAPVVPSPEEWGYRNKMEFSFFRKNGTVDLGLHERSEFDRYFPVPPCFICDADFLFAAEAVKDFARTSPCSVYDKRSHQGFYRHLVLRKGFSTGELLVNIVTGKEDADASFFAPLVERLKDKVASFYWTVNSGLSDVARGDELHLLHGKEAIEERLTVGGRSFSFRLSPFSFFQTNTRGTEKLYAAVIEALQGTKDDRVLDLYCGTGTIGLVVAPSVGSVFGVEQIASAVQNAEENRKLNGIDNISFAEGSVEKWIKHGEKPEATAIIVDPPRGGLSNKVIDFMVSSPAKKAVYVSCNPSTLARDLELLAAGGFRVENITPVDMFPQTYHIEAVVSLRR